MAVLLVHGGKVDAPADVFEIKLYRIVSTVKDEMKRCKETNSEGAHK